MRRRSLGSGARLRQRSGLHAGIRRASGPLIDVTILSPRWRRSFPRAASLCRASARATLARRAPTISHAELSIVLADDAVLSSLNRRYRRKNRPTNVLAFPGDAQISCDRGPPRLLGDVVLAYETVRAEARAAGRPMAHHLCHLVVHGVLHLLGHDHQEPRAALRMERLERDVLATMDIPDPYGVVSARSVERRRK
ncbi:MAG: rRNA maturation RNase YbeY [Alphaproteobacteria bacterium]